MFDLWQQELSERTFLWQKRLKRVLKYVQSGNLLDIGTGDGFFLNFSKRHFNTQATEISTSGVRYAEQHGHNVCFGELKDQRDLHSQSFNVITLWHVLEHVPHPKALLNDIHRLLKPDGIVAIAVPNELNPILRDSVLKPRHTVLPKHSFGEIRFGEEIHLSYFTPRVLRDSLSRVGFEILEFGVDDVHIIRNSKTMIKYHANRLLNSLLGTHFDTAMYVICKKS